MSIDSSILNALTEPMANVMLNLGQEFKVEIESGSWAGWKQIVVVCADGTSLLVGAQMSGSSEKLLESATIIARKTYEQWKKMNQAVEEGRYGYGRILSTDLGRSVRWQIENENL